MIPFAILSGRVDTTKGKSIEISILELSSEWFTFRLPRGFMEDGEGMKRLELSFYKQAEEEYSSVLLDNPKWEVRLDEYYDFYRVDTGSEEYQHEVEAFSGMYMDYVESRLTLSDEEHAARWSQYPDNQEEDFCSTQEEQICWFAEQIMKEIKSDSWKANGEYEIALQTFNLVSQYLNRTKEEFRKWYFENQNLEKHPISQWKLTGIVVGNPFCPHLFPEFDVLEQLLSKAKKEGLNVSFVLAPTSETMWEQQWERILWLYHYGKAHTMYIQIEVNDLGLCFEIENKLKDDIIKAKRGILLNKKRKDVRGKYLGQQMDYSILDQSERATYFPYYQMNTGTFCTLYAKVILGKRGNQKRVKNCARYCEDYCFIYPKHLDMIGRFNSLMGIKYSSLINGEELVEQAYGKRLVVNL